MKRSILLCLPWLLVGCVLERDLFEEGLAPEGPIAVGERLLWLDVPRSRLIQVDPGAALSSVEAKQERGVACATIPHHARGLVAGEREAWLLGETAKGSRLLRYDPVTGKEQATPLPRSFDKIWLGPGEGHALLTSGAGRAPLPGEPAARDLRAVGVVDLAKRAVHVVLPEAGGVPKEVVFSQAGELAAVLLERGLLVLDPGAPERRRLAILELADGTSLRPERAFFKGDGSHLVVQVTGGDNLLVLGVSTSAEAMDVSINLLSLPAPIVAAALPEGEGLGDYVAVSHAKGASLLDLSGDESRTRSVSLAGPPTGMLSFGDGRLLVHGKASKGGLFVAVWEPESGRIDQAHLEGALLAPLQRHGDNVFIFHGDSQARTMSALRVDGSGIELRLRRDAVDLAGEPAAAAWDASGGRLLVGLRVPGSVEWGIPFDFRGSIVSFDAADAGIDGLALDEDIEAIGVVGRWLWASHPAELGDLSLLPLDELSRGAAVRLHALHTTGLLTCAR